MKLLEQPLPKFEKEASPKKPQVINEEQIIEKKHDPIIEKQQDDLVVTIPLSEYVKAGYFGMQSYTIYEIETRVRNLLLFVLVQHQWI